MDYGKVHGKRVYTPAAAAGPAGVELRLSSGGQKMPSLKADYCLTLMSILVDPRVKRHTSSFDWAFLCTDAPWHVVASCPHNCHMWLLTEKVNKVKVCLKGFEYATSTILPPFTWRLRKKLDQQNNYPFVTPQVFLMLCTFTEEMNLFLMFSSQLGIFGSPAPALPSNL